MSTSSSKTMTDVHPGQIVFSQKPAEKSREIRRLQQDALSGCSRSPSSRRISTCPCRPCTTCAARDADHAASELVVSSASGSRRSTPGWLGWRPPTPSGTRPRNGAGGSRHERRAAPDPYRPARRDLDDDARPQARGQYLGTRPGRQATPSNCDREFRLPRPRSCSRSGSPSATAWTATASSAAPAASRHWLICGSPTSTSET